MLKISAVIICTDMLVMYSNNAVKVAVSGCLKAQQKAVPVLPKSGLLTPVHTADVTRCMCVEQHIEPQTHIDSRTCMVLVHAASLVQRRYNA